MAELHLQDGQVRILIVEDEPLIAMMLADWMAELGHEVVGTAARNVEALDLIAKTEPDAAVVDLLLMDGHSFLVSEDLQQRNIPFVVLTGATVEEPAKLTGIDILPKPIEFERLSAAVTAILVGKIAANRNGQRGEAAASDAIGCGA